MIILKKNIEEKNIYRLVESVSKNKKEIANNSIFNLNDWNTFKKDIIKFKNVGIFINSDEKFDPSIEELESFQIIQINFQTFKDGRPFSIAKNLRKKKSFKNQIRASGHILPDQYSFLLRCGFDSVEIEKNNKGLWLKVLEMEPEEKYQPFQSKLSSITKILKTKLEKFFILNFYA